MKKYLIYISLVFLAVLTSCDDKVEYTASSETFLKVESSTKIFPIDFSSANKEVISFKIYSVGAKAKNGISVDVKVESQTTASSEQFVLKNANVTIDPETANAVVELEIDNSKLALLDTVDIVLTISSKTNSIYLDNSTIKLTIIKAGSPQPTIHLAKGNTLKSGSTDTLFIDFDVKVSHSLVLNADYGSFTAILPVKESKKNYFSIYTASANENDSLKLSGTLNIAGGTIAIKPISMKLIVDNTAPMGTFTFASLFVKDSVEVAVNVKFDELMSGSKLYVSYLGQGTIVDTLKLMADQKTFSGVYSNKTANVFNGEIKVSLSNAKDLAGNTLNAIPVISKTLTIDNIKPVVSSVAIAKFTDGYAEIKASSNEVGTMYYVVLPKDSTIAVGAYLQVISNSAAVSIGSIDNLKDENVVFQKPLKKGAYKTHFVAKDRAGNYSDVITTTEFIMD